MRGFAVVPTIVAAVLFGSTAASVPPRTVIRANLTPFTADGHVRSGLRVAREARGSCDPGSDSLPNNVYRCFSGHNVLDPCWRDWRAPAPVVICLEEPWARTVVRLRLTATPDPSSGHSDLGSEPWGITLRSGARCLAFQGAHDTLTGKEGAPVIDYYCSNTLALVRGINRTHPGWTIRAARMTHQLSHPYTLIGRVAIQTAWYGGNNPLSHRP
jgi:hypothetical protein